MLAHEMMGVVEGRRVIFGKGDWHMTINVELKIALEEHFVTPDVIAKVTGGLPDPQVWEEAQRRLLDVTDLRLKAIVGSTGRAARLTQSRSACMHRHGHAPQVGLDLDDYALPHLDEEVPLSPWAEALKPMSDIAKAA